MTPPAPRRPAPVPPGTRDALHWCQAVTRRSSHTFYLASLLYPREARHAVWAVYAACRVGDDLVDAVTGPGAQERAATRENLADWRAAIAAAWTDPAGVQAEAYPYSRALAWATRRFPIPESAFEELHQGFLMDLDGREYATLADLEVYCRRVAGVVGLMIAPIGAYRGGEDTLRAALALGQAMQLTNILRDVGEDLNMGRVYLPADRMAAHGVTRADLNRMARTGAITPEYRALMRELSAQARAWYTQGRAGLPMLHGRPRLGVQVAARLYEGILDALEQGGYDNFTRRAHLPGRRRLQLAAAEVWRELRPGPPLPDTLDRPAMRSS